MVSRPRPWFLPFLFSLIVLPMTGPASGQTLLRGVDSSAGSVRTQLESTRPAFRRNAGQWSPEILYTASAGGAAARFLRQGVSFAYTRTVAAGKENSHPLGSEATEENEQEECLVWNVTFDGANPTARIVGENERPGVTSYLLGSDPASHHSNVPESERIWYRDLYPKIDLRYGDADGALKYDYIVRPGGDVSSIRMRCDGIERLRVNERGELEIETGWGVIAEAAPVAWQEIEGRRQMVDVRYAIVNDTTYGFSIHAGYRPEYELVIDPVILGWSTFVGGGAGGDGYLYNIALDAEGNVFGVGYYNSGFPTTPGVYQSGYLGYHDIFIFKLSHDGSRLLYGTYVGGTRRDSAYDVVVTAEGKAVVCGISGSTDFPTTPGAFDGSYNGGNDLVLFRLNVAGNALDFSTYLGGSSSEGFPRLALNSRGEIVVGATTRSGNFPTTSGARYPSLSGTHDAVVVIMSADGSALRYSTFIGGGSTEGLTALAAGHDLIVAGGTTTSADFPTTPGAFDQAGTGLGTSGWLLTFSDDGQTLLYSTMLRAHPKALAVAGDSSVVVAGEVPPSLAGGGFAATPGAYRTTYSGGGDAFLLRMNPAGTAPMFTTFLGGNRLERVDDVGITFSGDIVVSGSVYHLAEHGEIVSSTFPLTGCVLDSTHVDKQEGFISRLSGDGAQLIFSTLIGGSRDDYYTSLGLSPLCDESLVFGMTTHSPDFPTTSGAFQPVKLNGTDDQPAVLMLKPAVNPAFDADVDNCGHVSFVDRSRGECIWSEGEWKPNSWLWDFGDGTTSIEQSPMHEFAPGTYRVTLIIGTPCDSVTQTITIAPPVLDLDFSMNLADCGVVDFADLSRGVCIGGVKEWAPTSWLWDFGDGTTSTQRVVTHEYASAGTYRVKLIVGSPADSIMKTVEIVRPEITTDFTADVSECGTVVFTDLTQGQCASTNGAWALKSWQWDFGDGTTSTERSPTHEYTRPGIYPVKLVVGMPRDSITKMIEIRKAQSNAVVRFHVDRGHEGILGSDITLPVLLDDAPDSLLVTSVVITFSYDTTMMAPLDLYGNWLDRLIDGTQLEDWDLQVNRPESGTFVITATAPAGEVLRGPGTLLSLDFTTFLRAGVTTLADSVWRSPLTVDAVLDGPYCMGIAADPGLVTLSICGLRYRLMEMTDAVNKLEAAQPNPFNPTTVIPFSLAFDGPARLEVFNASGERVAVLLNASVQAGSYMIGWDATEYPSGVYYYRLSSGEWSQTRKMVVVK